MVRFRGRWGRGLGGAAATFGANALSPAGDADAAQRQGAEGDPGQLKGPLNEGGPMFATVPDLLPPEFAAQLTELQTNAPAMTGASCAADGRGTGAVTGRRGSAASISRPPAARPWARSTAPGAGRSPAGGEAAVSGHAERGVESDWAHCARC